MTTALAYDPREILLGVRKLIHQSPIAFGFFQRREVLPLHVLDKRDFQAFAITEFANYHRYFMKLCSRRRSPTSLSGYNLIGAGNVGVAAHEERLQNTLSPHTFDQ